MCRLIVISILLSLAACETTVKKNLINPETAASIQPNTSPNNNRAADNVRTLDEALGTDASAVRLDKIINAMLLYYSIKRDLPLQLTDLVPLTDGDLQLNGPTGQPYVYTRAGLRAPKMTKQIIVNDPAPSVNGRRWCILLDDTPPGASLLLEVQPIPESAFLGYR